MQVLQCFFRCEHQLIKQLPNFECRQCLLLIQHPGHIQGNGTIDAIICHCAVNQVMLLALLIYAAAVAELKGNILFPNHKKV